MSLTIIKGVVIQNVRVSAINMQSLTLHVNKIFITAFEMACRVSTTIIIICVLFSQLWGRIPA